MLTQIVYYCSWFLNCITKDKLIITYIDNMLNYLVRGEQAQTSSKVECWPLHMQHLPPSSLFNLHGQEFYSVY